MRDVRYDFAGRTALVTGGASGIGASACAMLAAAGANVVVADIDDEGARRFASELAASGGTAIGVVMDVTSPASCEAAVAAAVQRFGGLNMAVNNAGVAGPGAPVGAYPADEWRRILSINLDGVFHSMTSEFRALAAAGGGAIVNVASVMGTVAAMHHAAYTAAKHGVVGLSKAAALDGAAQGIRVNSVGPGYVETPLQARMPAERKQAFAERHALKRWAQADEIAGLICWLLSDQATFVTGSHHLVDGGFTAT